MPAAPVSHYEAPPAGVTALRGTILAGASPIALARAARACRSQSYALRRQMAEGRVRPDNLALAEDRIVDLLLMERVLADLSGAVAAADREDGPPPPFVSIGDAAQRVVASISEGAPA
jgi:hypothetical protein